MNLRSAGSHGLICAVAKLSVLPSTFSATPLWLTTKTRELATTTGLSVRLFPAPTTHGFHDLPPPRFLGLAGKRRYARRRGFHSGHRHLPKRSPLGLTPGGSNLPAGPTALTPPASCGRRQSAHALFTPEASTARAALSHRSAGRGNDGAESGQRRLQQGHRGPRTGQQAVPCRPRVSPSNCCRLRSHL